nr:uncharacterized protein LOC109179592 [Ipomoea batatas]
MTDEEASNAYHTMVMDAAGVQFNVDEIEESPNPEAQKFYDMLKAADQGLFPECKKHSQLSFVARLMSLKSENHISEKCFNQITELIKEVVPEDNLVPDNFYETKRLLRGMGLPVQKIDCCKNNCMIYWESDIDMTTWYYVNGFKFHTIGYGGAKETMNSGVCIKGINYSVDESDYYGRLVEVVQVEYPGLPIKRTVLFKCDWFDPTSVGMKVHSKYKLVEVNHKRRFNRYEPFILAMQAAQVYYCTYPSLRRDKLDWWAVCKIKARSNVEVPESSISTEDSLIPAPFQEETTDNHELVQIDEDPLHLDDPNGGVIELDGEHGDIEDEIELEEEIDDSTSDSVIGDSDNADLPIPSPSNSNAPLTSSSVAGSSTGCDLTIIHVENGRLIPSHACSSSMTKIFMKMIHPNGYAWKNVPNEYKDLYFEEFKKFYKWDESIEAQVRKVFFAQAGLRYADMLSKFKTKRTSTGRPACVAEETWAIWEAYWD